MIVASFRRPTNNKKRCDLLLKTPRFCTKRFGLSLPPTRPANDDTVQEKRSGKEQLDLK